MKLIGIVGKSGSGKDVVGKYLRIKQYTIYAFADRVKQACSKMFDIPLEVFYDESKKEVIIPEWGFSPREMIQKLGTDGGRDMFGKDIWIKHAQKRYDNYISLAEHSKNNQRYNDLYDIQYNGFAVTDIRFDNEAEWIRYSGGILIYIERDNAKEINRHSSEDGIKLLPNEFRISNNGTLGELYKKVDEILGC